MPPMLNDVWQVLHGFHWGQLLSEKQSFNRQSFTTLYTAISFNIRKHPFNFCDNLSAIHFLIDHPI